MIQGTIQEIQRTTAGMQGSTYWNQGATREK
jgi:hypothetical protein